MIIAQILALVTINVLVQPLLFLIEDEIETRKKLDLLALLLIRFLSGFLLASPLLVLFKEVLL